jgi:hypothetical protein
MVLCTDLQYFTTINSFIDLVKTSDIYFQPEQIFKRSTFRNRMMVPASNGIIQLSIPVVGGRSCKLPYGEVIIDYKSNWQKNHFHTLATVYGNSPWFTHYSAELETLFSQSPIYLFEWNMMCLDWVIKKTKLTHKITIHQDKIPEITPLLDKVDFYLPSNYDASEKGPFLEYPQVFIEKIGFKPNMSILDLIFNEGPNTRNKILSFID